MDAANMVEAADIVIIIGTSLQVYPAAGLIHYAFAGAPKYYIDPKAVPVPFIPLLEVIKKTAGEGVPELVDKLLCSVEV
jgi:NAD-dependent deacetylase